MVEIERRRRMAWDGFCIKCQRAVELEDAPVGDALPDCPVCSSPVVALADEADRVLWTLAPSTNGSAATDAATTRLTAY
jgi:hypothetical protein